MKKFIAMSTFVLSVLLFITACNVKKVNVEPEIIIKFKVSNLTNEEFQYVGTKKLDNPTKDDFKNIDFNLVFYDFDEISNRKIIMPNLKSAANSYDKKRYWFGESGTDDSPVKKYAKYDNKFTFYSKGLNEQDIKNIFNSCEVKASWTTSKGEDEEKTIKLGEIIEFQS